jgi:hypothetical protein
MLRFILALLVALLSGPAFAANTTLGNLTAGGAVSGADLFYDVQAVGVGGVKVTATQVKTFTSSSPTFTGTVTGPDAGTWAAGGLNSTIVGATTPLAGHFTTLSATGAVTFNSAVQTFPNTAATLAALNIVDQTLSGGANVTSFSIGTVSSGTTTIDCGKAPLQFLTNGGAFTLAAPASDGSCTVQIINSGTAGAVTFSGFTVNASFTGGALTTVNASKFMVSITRINASSIYVIIPQQ